MLDTTIIIIYFQSFETSRTLSRSCSWIWITSNFIFRCKFLENEIIFLSSLDNPLCSHPLSFSSPMGLPSPPYSPLWQLVLTNLTVTPSVCNYHHTRPCICFIEQLELISHSLLALSSNNQTSNNNQHMDLSLVPINTN